MVAAILGSLSQDHRSQILHREHRQPHIGSNFREHTSKGFTSFLFPPTRVLLHLMVPKTVYRLTSCFFRKSRYASSRGKR